ncbi:hypothetical protein [Sinorhizobium psoraleae]|nr:hypothetical protein [Sinorhizobium psoraleae]
MLDLDKRIDPAVSRLVRIRSDQALGAIREAGPNREKVIECLQRK